MSTTLQYDWIRSHRDLCMGPLADLGSRAPISRGRNSKVKWVSLRSLFTGESFVGIDMQKGRGVDLVCDLTQTLPTSLVDMFQTVFCISILEHVSRPWVFADNICDMLRPGGLLFVSVPWCWRYHGHPSDYWRMSPEALKTLFRALEVVPKASCIWHGVKQKPLKSFDIRLTRVYADREKHLMHPTTVNMVFRK